jgi:ferric-dicitrate binding protein FerR (iron transport regulator)
MKMKGIVAVALSALLLNLPASLIAASSAAGKMITTGSAEVNGIAAPAVTSVFAGDHIATQKEATMSLSFAGGDSVVLPELTKAALNQKDGRFVVNLEDGTVSVMNKTLTPILIEVNGASIRAASNQPALYDVTVHGNMLRVVAHSGAAYVETPNRSGNIEAGNVLTATVSAGPPPAGAGGGGGFPVWAIATIAVAAGAGLGVGIYEANKGSSSPSSN